MAQSESHCPFLNRADSRCAGYLSLDRLRHSYDYCFGTYSACRVYNELLAERRLRQAESPEGMNRISDLAEDDREQLVELAIHGKQLETAPPRSRPNPLVAAKAPATDRWSIWKSVGRGIAAGVHLRLGGAGNSNDKSSTIRSTDGRPGGRADGRPGQRRDAAAGAVPGHSAAAAAPRIGARAG